MALIDDLRNETRDIVAGAWDRREGEVVPEAEDLALTNEAVDFEATFLYADLADSTELAIANQSRAAEVCKAYLRGASRIIRQFNGEIRSFDGDRVMGVFIEGNKNTNAATAALKINAFFQNILVPAFSGAYLGNVILNHGVGVDTSRVMVVRGGIRNNNDLVWIGRAPNIAAKLSAIREAGYNSYITEKVFNTMNNGSKISQAAPVGNPPNTVMWERQGWAVGLGYGVGTIHRSSWLWMP